MSDDKNINFPKPLNAYKTKKTRYLIVTADDFGVSKQINDGIIEAVKNGFVNTIAAMITFENAIKSIKKFHRKNRKVGIGLHISITSGKPVTPLHKVKSLINKKGIFKNIDELLADISKINLLEVKTEIENQIKLLIDKNIKIDNLSSQHNILNTYTPFFKIMANIAKKYNIPMRSCLPSSLFIKELQKSKVKKRVFKMAQNVITHNPVSAFYLLRHSKPNEMLQNQNYLKKQKIIHPDYLIDTIWGEPNPQNLLNTLKHLPQGVSEIIFHVGKHETEPEHKPDNIDNNYLLMREMELTLATNKRIEQWLKILNIKIIKYKDIKRFNEM